MRGPLIDGSVDKIWWHGCWFFKVSIKVYYYLLFVIAMSSTQDRPNVLQTHKFCTNSLQTHQFKHQKAFRRKSQKLHQRQISDFAHMGKQNHFEGLKETQRIIKKKKFNSRFSQLMAPMVDDGGIKQKQESSLDIKGIQHSTKQNPNIRDKEEDSMDSDNQKKHRTSLMQQNKSQLANSLLQSFQQKKQTENNNSNTAQSIVDESVSMHKLSNGATAQLQKRPQKQFDEESQVVTLKTESESSLDEEYIEREVVYKLRFHLAPVIGPSLEMPTRLESFQVNVQYQCTTIQKVPISQTISPPDNKLFNKIPIFQSQTHSSTQTKDEALKQKSDVKEIPKIRKERNSSLRKDKMKSGETYRNEAINSNKKIGAQTKKSSKEIDPDPKQHLKESKLKSATNVLSFTILPSTKSHTKLDLPPRRSLNLSEESHKIFKSHPFLDNALKNRNKIQSKLKRSEPTERPTKYKQKMQEGSLQKHNKESKQKQKEKMKTTKAIAKRNINELKLKQTIKQAKLEVIPEVNGI